MIAEQNGIAKDKSTEHKETLIEFIKHPLASGEDVQVSGFGKFCVKNKDKRRDPSTGSDLKLQPEEATDEPEGLPEDHLHCARGGCATHWQSIGWDAGVLAATRFSPGLITH